MNKICNTCKIELPLTETYFNKRKDSNDGYTNRCKICTKEYKRKYVNHNHEHVVEYNKNYYKDNKDFVLQLNKQYYLTNIDAIKLTKKHYYEENKEYFSALGKTYYEENKENALEHCKQYKKEHKDQVNIECQVRRAKKKQLPHTLTIEQWEQIKKDFNNKCAYCGQVLPLTQEHLIPVNKGGGYTKENIIPACNRCNCSKHDNDFDTWYLKQPFYNKESFILKYINREVKE